MISLINEYTSSQGSDLVVGSHCFYYCANLSKISFPSFLKKLEKEPRLLHIKLLTKKRLK